MNKEMREEFKVSGEEVLKKVKELIRGNLGLLVQLHYNGKHVKLQSNTVGSKNHEISASDSLRKEYVLSGLPVAKGRAL